MVNNKIEKLWNRRYITIGSVLSLTILFRVPDRDSDIRLVYDLTYCGLNEAPWDTKSCTPSAENVLDTATHSYWSGDVDSSKMLHNYKLSEKAQTYAEVDVSWAEKVNSLSWERWTRMAMGFLYYPFATTRMIVLGVEVIMVDKKDEANPFYWDSVVQNCPGTNEYDPSMPRLYWWDSKRQVITAA